MRILAGIIVLFLVQLASAQHQQGTEKPNSSADAEDVIRVDSNLVSVPVSVADRNGKFVANLGAADFQLFDNERERKIEYFESSEQPFSVLLLLDTSGSTASRLEDIKSSALALINQLKPNDRLLPIAFDMQIKPLLRNWTNDGAVLRKTIQDARIGVDLKLAKQKVETGIGGKKIIKYYVNTRLYDAVQYAVEICRQIRGRKAIILLSDGLDTGSEIASYKSTIRAAAELDALFYTVKYDKQRFYLRGILPAPEWDALEYMKSLAEKSGATFRQANDIEKVNEAFEAIAQELRQTYTLGFYVDGNEAVAEGRKLEVKTKRPKLVVRGRKAYLFKPKETNK
jgi:VWFA-related protein